MKYYYILLIGLAFIRLAGCKSQKNTAKGYSLPLLANRMKGFNVNKKRGVMKKMQMICFIPVLMIAGCMAGNISKDGAILKPYLEPAKLMELVENPIADIWIIDVRPSSDYAKGHIPTAKNFSSSDIMDRLEELPKSQYLIVYCETGIRAGFVISKLEKEGYTRMMNWGGYTRWSYELEK
jgi:rhodanese-related sulfurtransferase